MTTKKYLTLLITIVALAISSGAQSEGHPKLLLTKAGVENIRSQLGTVPLFDASLKSAKEMVDAEITLGIDTPIPKDFSGGYTHQRHKRNYQVAQTAGVLFQLLQDEQYAQYVRDMLFQYAAMYKDLPLHPQERSYARGKLFWQCLNESVWLVSMSQAYDAIHDWLSVAEREQLEAQLFRPYADFISNENTQFFNRVHNHSTWATAAVGMIGLVMDDEELIERALYGAKDAAGLNFDLTDNDGGFIRVRGEQPGFLSNLDAPFSPDGYFTEGPYYQRYAMYPFLVFARAMDNVRPEMQVLQYKDGVLLKAVDVLLKLTDADGEFFTLNDAQKGMSYYTPSLVAAVDMAYYYGGENPQLLSIAEKQGSVLLDEAGLSVALGVRDGKAIPFKKSSMNLGDGADGKQGGVAVLRSGDEDLSLVFKYSAQGLSHGHYDKLSFSLFERGDEVLQDYGMVRFVNIQKKGGGNYLPENKTWAKQTIAHNALTLNETSHFGGNYETGSKHHSELHFFDASRDDIQIVSARESNAYPGTVMLRTMAVIKAEGLEKPFVLDLMKVSSASTNQYDLPFYFMGQLIDTSFDYEAPGSLELLGSKNGYQHLYLEGSGASSSGNASLTWLANDKFYTLTTVANSSDELIFSRLGASDRDFNLRRDAAFMIRRKNAEDTVFATVIEPHGSYNPVSELSLNANSSIAKLDILHDDQSYTAIALEGVQGEQRIFILSNEDASSDEQHRLKLGGKAYKWTGPYYFSNH
ncbi:MAG: alginate lyase family protein [Halioglobus sp.]